MPNVHRKEEEEGNIGMQYSAVQEMRCSLQRCYIGVLNGPQNPVSWFQLFSVVNTHDFWEVLICQSSFNLCVNGHPPETLRKYLKWG